MLTGASTGPSLDGALAKASAISFRTPYQTNDDLRDRINQGKTALLRHAPFADAAGDALRLPRARWIWAVVEACDVTAGGGIVLTSAVGTAPTFCNQADKILIELNRHNPPTLLGIHDIYEPADPPNRRQIPDLLAQRPHRLADHRRRPPSKIAGIVETNLEDEARGFSAVSPLTGQIGHNVAEFLAAQLAARHDSPRASCRFNPAWATSPTPSSARSAAIPISRPSRCTPKSFRTP